MENKANYALIGLFTLAVIAGAFGFVFWLQSGGTGGERTSYRVAFDGSVSGLRTGSAVLFNGIRVGEVTGLALDAKNPQQVIATVSIAKAVPVHQDTHVGMEFQGLTGIASLSLRGGTASSPVLVGSIGNPPLLQASPAASSDVTQSARDVMRRLNEFLADNQKAFHGALENIDKVTATLAENSKHIDSALQNIDKFTGALARNSDRIDQIVAGAQNLIGGEDGKSGQINQAASSIRALADKLDKRTASVVSSFNELTAAGKRQLDALSSDAHRTLNTLDRTIKNIDQNPSRLLWGGAPAPPASNSTRR